MASSRSGTIWTVISLYPAAASAVKRSLSSFSVAVQVVQWISSANDEQELFGLFSVASLGASGLEKSQPSQHGAGLQRRHYNRDGANRMGAARLGRRALIWMGLGTTALVIDRPRPALEDVVHRARLPLSTAPRRCLAALVGDSCTTCKRRYRIKLAA
jgi:hypothetical protein